MKIYLTNASSRKPPHRGPGRVWTIMAAPRPQYGEAGEGTVGDLVPVLACVRDVKAGRMPWKEYRDLYLSDIRGRLRRLRPGSLDAWHSNTRIPVADGDTLICCCSRAAAADGKCHRAWAAVALQEAGWTVVLDGVELSSEVTT